MVVEICGEMLIADRRREASAGEWFDTFDPSSGEVIAQVARGREADVDEAVAVAAEAFESLWFDSLPYERARALYRVGAELRSRADEFAELDALNVGLPTPMARMDVEVAARYFEYYAGIADKIQGESIPLGPDYVDFTVREPWGVCAVIAPFNVPLQLSARSLAPALAAGNTVVLKPAEQAPLPSLRLGEIMLEAGIPPGVINVVPGFGADAGERLVSHPGISHISFTGSRPTGERILASAAAQLTPVTLELGGKSPQIIFADADLEAAANAIVGSALLTAGQVCSAGTRVLAEEPIRDQIVDLLADRARSIKVGRPLEGGEMGPLISEGQQAGVLKALERARASGARVIVGGGRPQDAALQTGFFVEPTVLDGVTQDMPIAREEVFGPVLAVVTVANEDAAIAVANDTDYGLVAGVWTQHIGRAHRVARRVRAGQIFINNYGVGGGVELPFGGYKKSGLGREKGLAALHEYTQIKNICARIS
jgi:aldehyde dehydrogenase (NAD+)